MVTNVGQSMSWTTHLGIHTTSSKMLMTGGWFMALFCPHYTIFILYSYSWALKANVHTRCCLIPLRWKSGWATPPRSWHARENQLAAGCDFMGIAVAYGGQVRFPKLGRGHGLEIYRTSWIGGFMDKPSDHPNTLRTSVKVLLHYCTTPYFDG